MFCATEIILKDKSRCHEFMKHGILKRIPVKAIEISNINTLFDCKMQFYRPVATTPPDSWNSSCEVSEIFAYTSTHLNLCYYSMTEKVNGSKKRNRVGQLYLTRWSVHSALKDLNANGTVG